MIVERHFDAQAINRVLNDSIVRPWVADAAEGVLDISPAVADKRNVLLMGEHGGCMFFCLMHGFYEVHTQVLPSGRGRWAAEFTKAAGAWLYCHTPAIEILTRVPAGHVSAEAASRAAGMRFRWSRPGNTVFRGQPVDVSVYGHTIEDWVLQTLRLEEIGAEFHDRLHAFALENGITGETHADDPNHNHFVGGCIEIARGGQIDKAVALYNKWAIVSRHRPVRIVSREPPAVGFDIGILRIIDGELEIEPCSPPN